MGQTTSHSHYVPRGYLSRWANGESWVWEHKLVVPVAEYPVWRKAQLREAGARRNLYDTEIPGLLRDHYEEWLHREVEAPAFQAMNQLERGVQLDQRGWEALVRFAIAQDLRTPKSREIHKAFEEHYLPQIAKRVLHRVVRDFERGSPDRSSREHKPPIDERLIVETSITPHEEGVRFELAVTTGNTSWMQRNKRMVRGFTERVGRLRWQLLRPGGGRTWPTSDSPLIRFERRQGIAIHGTGWLRPGTEIFLPLNPWQALYTRVGAKERIPELATVDDTLLLIKLVIGQADRSIFSDRQDRLVAWESRRRVDREAFHHGP